MPEAGWVVVVWVAVPVEYPGDLTRMTFVRLLPSLLTMTNAYSSAFDSTPADQPLYWSTMFLKLMDLLLVDVQSTLPPVHFPPE